MADEFDGSSLAPAISRSVAAPSPARAFAAASNGLDREEDAHYRKFMFRKTLVVVACLLAAVVVVAHWSTAVRFFLFLLRRSRARRVRRRRGSGSEGGDESARESENGNESEIVVLGTFKAEREDENSRALRPIQVVQFGKASGRNSGECMICLSEFQTSEKIGLLPDCGHGFHRPCIEMWLFTHSNCPICRHSLVEEEDAC